MIRLHPALIMCLFELTCPSVFTNLCKSSSHKLPFIYLNKFKKETIRVYRYYFECKTRHTFIMSQNVSCNVSSHCAVYDTTLSMVGKRDIQIFLLFRPGSEKVHSLCCSSSLTLWRRASISLFFSSCKNCSFWRPIGLHAISDTKMASNDI